MSESTSTSSISEMLASSAYGSASDSGTSAVKIMGAPYRFNSLADPNDRLYSQTYMMDCCTVSFYPGKPKYRKTDPEIVSKAESFFESDDGDGEQTFLDAVEDATKGLTDNSSTKDYRYYAFEDDYENYKTYLNLMLEYAAAPMGVSTGGIDTYMSGTWKSHGLSYYAGKQANVSESFSNSFGDSTIANVSKTMSDAAKEMQFLTGTDSQMGTSKGLASSVTNAVSSLTKTLSMSDSVDNAVSEINNGIQSALSGMNMAYPQIWKDSSFSRSYNMTFEFYSPYGDAQSIFGNVYVPFLSLLALAAPRQNQTSSYGSPFICKVDCPGFFTSDLAVVTSIDWKKGGNDNLWSKDGLPLAMTVSLNVADLFPVMFIAKTPKQLTHNTGLHGFLNNMAGYNIEAFNNFADIKNEIKARTGFFMKAASNTAMSKLTSGVWKITYGRHVNM